MWRGFLSNKNAKSVAVLKCLGASGTRIITVYLLQILTLGFFGSLFGVLLAQFFLWFANMAFNDALPAKMSYAVHFSIAWQGILLGVLISFLFSALPLLQVRNIKPRLLLHDATGEKTAATRLDKNDFRRGFARRIACTCGLASRFASKSARFFSSVWRLTSVFLYFAAVVLTITFAKNQQFRLVFHRASHQFAVSSGKSNADYFARRRTWRVCRSRRSIFAGKSRPRIRFYAQSNFAEFVFY